MSKLEKSKNLILYTKKKDRMKQKLATNWESSKKVENPIENTAIIENKNSKVVNILYKKNIWRFSFRTNFLLLHSD